MLLVPVYVEIYNRDVLHSVVVTTLFRKSQDLLVLN